MKAITTQEITGRCIETIPAGTEFDITYLSTDMYSSCSGLGITSIWNDEFKLLPVEPEKYILDYQI